MKQIHRLINLLMIVVLLVLLLIPVAVVFAHKPAPTDKPAQHGRTAVRLVVFHQAPNSLGATGVNALYLA
ncbi:MULTISPECIES: hypothetical protein [Hymenobacter]|uniref:Uncharacterized protein n=1 Tax=Hymenobacter jejuensis TaxID=2502781 RepID=A0A5B8A251_9BACT|nr:MULTISPECIES: hypothetical protein [Hymenobacter]MBC6989345.1 hypothetical protein [Hymenobacter sp. BT491]QDA61378.1 hypothetical protein FHG12_15295 [Hymenobacter jejuensis]